MAATCTSNPPSSLCKLIKCCNPSSPFTKNCSKISSDQDEIWCQIRHEAESDMKHEPLLSNLYHSAIISHSTLESALSNHLALKLSTPYLSTAAIRVAAHRLAHKLWIDGGAAAALLIQSRVSEVFAVDIHPGAAIGGVIVMDHAIGVVIGETAVVGDGVTILHGVTLGGTAASEDRRWSYDWCWGENSREYCDRKKCEDRRRSCGFEGSSGGATAVGNPARLVGFRGIQGS
ncbi:hypothetical protein SASPL_146623 [Salvia splendens]|uniref:Serine acetyltransferase N-terminal domain-containing protein n=1 Tax=Salvia splendens TaxID=180675 RepID=A0A8X8WD33_SALSN|nr:hypothetical protein SASPL_146623 [Salvia splendens]